MVLIDALLEAFIDGKTTHLDRALDCWRRSSPATLVALARCSKRLRQAVAPHLYESEEESAAIICAHFGRTREQLAAQSAMEWREGLPPAQQRHLGTWLLPGGPLAGVAELLVQTASRPAWADLTPLRSGAMEWNLTGCAVNCELMSILAVPLSSNASLNTLMLQANNIGDPGAIAIAKALELNASLKKLVLGSPYGGNNIGDQGAIALAEALKVNATMTTLRCVDHPLTIP